MTRPELIHWIVETEWTFFSTAQNEGGRASCQEDPKTFSIMRCAQFDAWDEPTLEAYKANLTKFAQEGRNPIAEKYGHMMAFTDPAAYAKIEHLLRKPTITEKYLAGMINEILVKQTEVCMAKYPAVMKRGRPIHSSEDTPYNVSSQTYMLCELYTYGEDTLKCLYTHILNLRAKDQNYIELVQENTAIAYGYASLRAANDAMLIASR